MNAPTTVEDAWEIKAFWNVCRAVHVLAVETDAPPKHALLIAKQPPVRLNPLVPVDVAVPVRANVGTERPPEIVEVAPALETVNGPTTVEEAWDTKPPVKVERPVTPRVELNMFAPVVVNAPTTVEDA